MLLICKLGCSIPIADDPEKIVIPNRRTLDTVVQNLSYIMEDNLVNNGSDSSPLFGGHQSWAQREKSFKPKPNMKVNYYSIQLISTSLFQINILTKERWTASHIMHLALKEHRFCILK